MAPEKKELSMEMRVLIAFALSAVILFLYVPLQKRYFPPPPRPPEQAAAKPETAPPPAAAAPAAPAASTPAAPKPAQPAGATQPAAKKRAAPAAAPAATVTQASQEGETVVENDLYRVAFSNRGAVVKSWVLKKFRDNKNHELELVNGPADALMGYPMMVWVDDDALREKLKNALFQVRASSTRAPATVTFEYSDGTTAARKEFHFEHGSYVAKVSSEVTNAAT